MMRSSIPPDVSWQRLASYVLAIAAMIAVVFLSVIGMRPEVTLMAAVLALILTYHCLSPDPRHRILLDTGLGLGLASVLLACGLMMLIPDQLDWLIKLSILVSGFFISLTFVNLMVVHTRLTMRDSMIITSAFLGTCALVAAWVVEIYLFVIITDGRFLVANRPMMIDIAYAFGMSMFLWAGVMITRRRFALGHDFPPCPMPYVEKVEHVVKAHTRSIALAAMTMIVLLTMFLYALAMDGFVIGGARSAFDSLVVIIPSIGVATILLFVNYRRLVATPPLLVGAIGLAMILHGMGVYLGLYDSLHGTWDIVTHFTSSLIVAVIGFLILAVYERFSGHSHLTLGFYVLFIVGFTAMFGIIWEFGELLCDELVGTGMQYSKYMDTNLDMLSDLGGSIVAAIGATVMMKRIDVRVMVDSMGIDPMNRSRQSV